MIRQDEARRHQRRRIAIPAGRRPGVPSSDSCPQASPGRLPTMRIRAVPTGVDFGAAHRLERLRAAVALPRAALLRPPSCLPRSIPRLFAL